MFVLDAPRSDPPNSRLLLFGINNISMHRLVEGIIPMMLSLTKRIVHTLRNRLILFVVVFTEIANRSSVGSFVLGLVAHLHLMFPF